MGKSSTTNSSSSTNGTSNVVQTPTNPAWVDQGLSQFGNAISGLASADPTSFVAGPSPLQQTAAANAMGLTGTPWNYSAANDVLGGVAQANTPDIASKIQGFMSPYLGQVINPTLAAFDQNSAQTNAANKLATANDTTFGGSGAAITDALTRGQQALARGQLQGGLLNQGYDTALSGATSQAQLQQQQLAQRIAAAQAIGANSTAFNNAENQNVQTQAGLGGALQELQQAQAGAPITLTGALASIFGGLPLNLEHGQNINGVTSSNSTGTSTTNTSDPLGTIGSLLSGGGSLASGLGAIGFKI